MMPPTGVDDPYRPPATATSAPPASGRRIGWKVYFWIAVAWSVGSTLKNGVLRMQPIDVVDLAVAALGFTGVFAYAYRRRLWRLGFWKRWVPFQIAWDLAIVLHVKLQSLGLFEERVLDEITLGVAAIVIAPLLPLWVALFRYAFRSPEIWSSAG